MFRTIGIIAALLFVFCWLAYYKGYIDISGNISITNKGKNIVNNSLNNLQELTNDGFNTAKDFAGKKSREKNE